MASMKSASDLLKERYEDKKPNLMLQIHFGVPGQPKKARKISEESEAEEQQDLATAAKKRLEKKRKSRLS